MRPVVVLLGLSAVLGGCPHDDCDPSQTDLVGDGLDQNCDLLDGIDGDNDGHASIPSGGDDCDDTDIVVHPGEIDVCNGIDDDCSGVADDGVGSSPWWRDADGDGFGVDGDELLACDQPEGYAGAPGDCDDARAVVNPRVNEACNGFDDDCDGVTDGPGSDGFASWHLDADRDGFGDPAVTVEGCLAPSLHVLDDTDCDDVDPDIHPGAVETCDGLDEDCDGTPDDDAADAGVWTVDGDGDGYGDDLTAVVSCDPIPGSVPLGGDCDDEDPARSPGAPEICGGIDEDCDQLIDDADPDSVGPVWYGDGDGDGHGDPAAPERSCLQPPGAVAAADDCDDGDASVHVGAFEVPDDGVDQDCDGSDPPDFDRDGWSTVDDCDDTDPNIAPSATDITGDDIDQNCDGVDGTDIDGDGDPSVVSGGTDCDDHDPTVYGGAPEILADGIDNGCGGAIDVVRAGDAVGSVVGIREADRVGDAVTGADYDGDGVVELVVGAPQRYDGSNLADSRGRVLIFEPPLVGDLTEADASAVITGVTLGSGHLGEWVGTVPDLDGDGNPELAVGDDEVYDVALNRFGAGAVYLWFGLPSGAVDADDADLTVLGAEGTHVSRVSWGEVTGDGLTDLLLPYEDRNNYNGGVELLAGPFAPGTIDAAAGGAATFTTSSSQARLSRVAAGDLDGDGVDDVALGAWSFSASPGPTATGRISIEHGPLSGAYNVDTSADATFTGNVPNGFLGDVLAVGDLDGDGVDEVVSSSGAYADPSYRGRLWIFSGPFAGAASVTAATATIEGDEVYQGIGSDLELPGDLDGDGFADLLVGAELSDSAFFLRGPFVGSLRLADLRTGTIVGQASGFLGANDTLAVVGDVTGDGSPDLWIGEPSADAEVSFGGVVRLLPMVW